MPTTSAEPGRLVPLLVPVWLVTALRDFVIPLVSTARRMLLPAAGLPLARRVERVA